MNILIVKGFNENDKDKKYGNEFEENIKKVK